jgi:hypothetical protein
MKAISYVAALLFTVPLFVFTACDEDDLPPEENPEETITNITLTFTPDGGGTPVLATWVDADGEGSGNPVVSDIELAANTTYIMRIELTNALDPNDPEDITEEVREEAEEHIFFFGWTDGIFSDPTGSGNIGAGNRDNAVNYDDPNDDNGYPVGLRTQWTTGPAAEGEFRLILKHQPDIKSATSDSTDGETDVDATWDISIQ